MSEEKQPWIFDFDYAKPLEPNWHQRQFIISHWERIYISRDPHYNPNSNTNNNDYDSYNTTTSVMINKIASKPNYNVQLGLDVINLISKYSFPVPLGLHCDCKLHFMTNIKHENSIKRRLKQNTNGATMNEETIYRQGTMIYMDSLNPYVPIKLERVLWNGTRRWKFMFQSFNFSSMYGKQRSINEQIRSVLDGDGHDDVDATTTNNNTNNTNSNGNFLYLGNSNTINENEDINLYNKFRVLICGIFDDNREYSKYLYENNIKPLYITQNQVYEKKYQSHVLCLTNNINKLNNDEDYDCNQFNYILYCIDKQTRVELYNKIYNCFAKMKNENARIMQEYQDEITTDDNEKQLKYDFDNSIKLEIQKEYFPNLYQCVGIIEQVPLRCVNENKIVQVSWLSDVEICRDIDNNNNNNNLNFTFGF